jgi:hypothetical protein
MLRSAAYLLKAGVINLHDVLLKYRVHGNSRSEEFKKTQLEFHDAIAYRTISELFPKLAISLNQVSELRSLFITSDMVEPRTTDNLQQLVGMYLDLLDAFLVYHSNGGGYQWKIERKALKRHAVLKTVYALRRVSSQRGKWQAWALLNRRFPLWLELWAIDDFHYRLRKTCSWLKRISR